MKDIEQEKYLEKLSTKTASSMQLLWNDYQRATHNIKLIGINWTPSIRAYEGWNRAWTETGIADKQTPLGGHLEQF